jgi:hypothetical protein
LHAGSLPRFVWQVQSLCDYPIKTYTEVEPPARLLQVVGYWRHLQPAVRASYSLEKSFESSSSVTKRNVCNFARFVGQQIKNDELARHLLTQFLYATRRRMDSHQKAIEGQISINGNDNLAVKYELVRLQFLERSHEFRKITRQRFLGFRLQVNLRAVSKCEATKTVPFGFVAP